MMLNSRFREIFENLAVWY